MTTCANCSHEAVYTYEVTPSYLIHYCYRHLPGFLHNQKSTGSIALKVEVEAPRTSRRRTAEAVVEEPVVEEVVETPVEEEPVDE